MNTPTQSQRPPWLDGTATNPDRLTPILMAATVVLASIPLLLFWMGDYLPVAIATLLLPLSTLVGVIWLRLSPAGRISEAEGTRSATLGTGGLLGLSVLCVAIVLAVQWWDYVAGGLEVWRGADGWRIWVVAGITFAGLALMFLSLQLGRNMERSNPAVRRLLYGYNAILAGLLLLGILGFANVLAYAYVPSSVDWTAKNIYSLSSLSENTVQGLSKQTRIYVILSPRDFETRRRVEALINNCIDLNDKIQAEYLSPDLDRERVGELVDKYKFNDERGGILVAYGNEPNTEAQFIRRISLYEGSNPMSRQQENRVFKGESELMNVLSYLGGGRKKPVVYFTQGNGELDIGDFSTEKIDRGAGRLKQRLEQSNVTVKGLQFSTVEGIKTQSPDMVVSSKVPDDATVVVVAGPQRALPEFGVKAIRDYMTQLGGNAKPQGRLFVLLDVVLAPDKTKMLRTGLEDLMGEYKVQFGDNRIIRVLPRNPLLLAVTTNPEQSVRVRNPIVSAFEGAQFLFYDARTVQANPPATPDPGKSYNVDTLLVAPKEGNIWAESDLRASPTDLLKKLLAPENRQELLSKISREDLPLGVAVTETAPSSDPHAFMQEGTPRVVAFGDSMLLSNSSVDRVPGAYDLCFSILNWLGERPSNIGIEAKREDTFALDPGVNYTRMILLPMALMLLGIIGLGTSVWVVRRR